jgi:hypothetical protein
MTTIIFVVFCIVYLGMILGGLPFLQLDRTGIALLGAIALIGVEAVSPEEAAKSIHLPTLLLLFSFMVVSAQMRLGGFYAWVTRRPDACPGEHARGQSPDRRQHREHHRSERRGAAFASTGSATRVSACR